MTPWWKLQFFWCFNRQQKVSTNGICVNDKGTTNVSVPKSFNRVNNFSSSILLELAFICNYNTWCWLLVHNQWINGFKPFFKNTFFATLFSIRLSDYKCHVQLNYNWNIFFNKHSPNKLMTINCKQCLVANGKFELNLLYNQNMFLITNSWMDE